MLITNPTIGSDVEFFVEDKEGMIVSAEGLIPGTKQEPFRFDPHNPFFATQLDNVLAEGNIPPAKSAAEFIASLTALRKHMDTVLGAKGLHTKASGAEVLQSRFLETENAQTLGCSPSFDAWSMKEVSPPPELAKKPFRSAGFHVHVGYREPNKGINVLIARAMDLYLGLPAVLIEPNAEMRRNAGFGFPGNMRHQPHGVEYRTLSSFFARDERLIKWVYDNTMATIAFMNTGGARFLDGRSGRAICQTIAESDRKSAAALIKAYRVEMPR